MRQHKRILSLFLAILMVMTTGVASAFTAFAADGNEAKIGDTEYATLAAAINAAADGATITLLKNVTWTAKDTVIKKTITIDGGEQKYKITANEGYIFHFYQSFTLKNLTLDTSHGFRFYNTAGKEAVGTLENVDWTLGGGLLVNIQGGVADVPQTFNVVNSTITKKAVAGDPIIATYGVDTRDVTINIENSTLTQNGGANGGHTGNTSMFYFNNGLLVTLNLKGNTMLNYNPIGKADVVQSAIVYNRPTAINAESDVQVNLLGGGAATDKNYFTYKTGGSLNLTDSGAKWNASKAVAGRGFYLPAAGSYDVNESCKAVVTADKPVYGGTEALTYRKASTEYTESELDDAGRAYSGYSFKIGTGYYRTWAEALAADGDITLLANAPRITAEIKLTKDVVVNGQEKYTLSSYYGYNFFNLAGHNATFRNLTIDATHGVRTDGVEGPNVLFENCVVNVTKGLLINFNKNANVTFKNTTVISTAADPVILLQGGAVSEINLINSTIDYQKGATNYDDNTSIINIANKSQGTVVMDGKSKLIYNPTNAVNSNQIISVHDAETAATVNLKAGAVLEYNTVPASVTSLAFLRSNATLNLVDEGATWKVSETVATKGYRFVNNSGTFNCKTVAMRTAEGKLYSPTEVINLTAATAFVPVTMGVTNEAGASIRLSESSGIRFGTQIDKTFYDTLGTSAVYGIKVALAANLTDGNFAALTDENSVSYTSAKEGFRWVTEGEFFRTVLMNIGEANYQTELSWTAFVTITYADGKTATYYADYTEADNCRSLADVANSALNDATVTWTAEETALLNKIAGNTAE